MCAGLVKGRVLLCFGFGPSLGFGVEDASGDFSSQKRFGPEGFRFGP